MTSALERRDRNSGLLTYLLQLSSNTRKSESTQLGEQSYPRWTWKQRTSNSDDDDVSVQDDWYAEHDFIRPEGYLGALGCLLKDTSSSN